MLSDVELQSEPQPEQVATTAWLKPKAEEVFRGLWASLFYSGNAVGKSVLICAANQHEGASTIACGMALAGSESVGEASVALVDFNLRRPAIHRILRINEGPGIGDVIAGDLAIESTAQRVGNALDVYTVGTVNGRILDMLRSDSLGRFIETLCSRYDRVLVDAAAVNHYPDAQVLAGAVRDIVLVANSEQTPREAVAQAKKRLESGGGRVVGVVLNLRTYPIPGFLYRRV